MHLRLRKVSSQSRGDGEKNAFLKKQSYLKINKDVLWLVQEQKDVSVHMGSARLGSTDLLWPPFLYTYETSAENSFPPHQS